MSEKSITEWRIYCNDEQSWVHGFKDTTDGPPLTCFSNTSHSVNTQSVQELDVISNNVVIAKIQEESIETGGYFRSHGFKFTIPANSTESHEVSWPYPITVLESFFVGGPQHEGNVINVIVGDDTIVGALVSQAIEGTNTLNVSPTVIANIKVGFNVKVSSQSVGRVLSVNTSNNTITISQNLSQTHNAGSYVKMSVHSIEEFEMGSEVVRYIIGSSKTGGKYLPTNVKAKVVYINNTNSSVVFRYQVEILY